ncbi:hypothetical protein O181_083228 [Austropuccinia psidii MF-1]|uniref:Uncharacterized protein n=1 Tax=Austropuccinia psidii MF-1 TaxID=1389203 RepID=A0A9Q3FNZ5_9BASI|nr:hypothetical protein [Austropuccinia psidii MF-1]
MSTIHLRDLGIPRNQQEERKGVLRLKRPGVGKYGEWQDTQGNHAHTPIHLSIQQRHQARRLDRHRSSTSAPPTPQRPDAVEHGTQENMKPPSQGHVIGNNSHIQEEIKPAFPMEGKYRSPSKYQDGDNMTYSEKEDLKKLPEDTSWPKFSDVGEYDNMELMDYIYGLFIYVPSIPDYWITARLNTELKVMLISGTQK